MKRYCVTFERITLYKEKGFVYVEAGSEEEAQKIATAKIVEDECDEMEEPERLWQEFKPGDIEIGEITVE